MRIQHFFRVHLDLFSWSASWFIAPKTVTPCCLLSRLLHLKPQMFLPLSVKLEMRLQTSKKIIPGHMNVVYLKIKNMLESESIGFNRYLTVWVHSLLNTARVEVWLENWSISIKSANHQSLDSNDFDFNHIWSLTDIDSSPQDYSNQSFHLL